MSICSSSQSSLKNTEAGEHLFQQPEFIEENKKCTSKQMRALVDIDKHLFQQPEFKDEDKKKWCAERKQ